MKLGALKIPNTQINVIESKTFNSEELNNKDIFIVSDILDSDYDDISSIENWDSYGLSSKFNNGYIVDYKVIRDEIAKLTLDKIQFDWGNWDNLTDKEKDIVCKYVCCPKSLIFNRFPDKINELLKNWDDESTKARKYRYEILVRNTLFNYLTEKKALMCLRTVSENGLLLSYFGGLEGSLEDDGVEGLFDYILSREGTAYENNGLIEKIVQEDITKPYVNPNDLIIIIYNLLYRGY
jgi:hypothetical protein